MVRPEEAGIGAGAAEVGEGGFGAQPLGIVAGGDQQLAGGLDPDPGQGDQAGATAADQGLELGVELVELGLELLPAASQAPQAGLGGGVGAAERPGPHRCAGPTSVLVLRPSSGWRSSSGAL